MPQIVPLTGAPVIAPPISQAFAPNFAFPTYRPSDFTAAYQYGPHPVDPTELANTLSAAYSRGAQLGQIDREWDALAPERQLAGDQSTAAARAFEQNTPLSLQAPPPQPSLFNRLGQTFDHTLDGTLGDHAADSKPLALGVPAVPTSTSPLATGAATGTVAVTPAGPLATGTSDLPANPSPPSPVSLTPKTTDANAFSNASAPDENGFHSTIATTFATPKDTANFAQTGSLATGDNGVGAWGDKTTGSEPIVALPPATLKAYGIDPDKARGQQVEITANGQTVLATVGDKMPDNSKNGAGIDLNPGTASALGIEDINNFKGPVKFRLVSQPTTTGFFASSNTPAQGNLAVGFGEIPANPLKPLAVAPPDAPAGSSANLAGNALPADASTASVVPGDTRYTNGKPLVLPAASPAMIAAASRELPVLQSNVLTNAGDLSNAPASTRPLAITPPLPAATGLTPLQQLFANTYGTGAIAATPDGHVGYTTPSPLNALQAGELSLLPQKAELERQQVLQDQQRLNQSAALAPLQLQAEQSKLNLQQRQLEAAAVASQGSQPIIVPSHPDGTASPANSNNAATPFAPGHVLVPQFVTQIKDGFPVASENPTLGSSLNAASSHGVSVDEHTTVINGKPYIDLTSLGHASGSGAVAMRESGQQFTQKYLAAQSSLDAMRAYLAKPQSERSGAGDDNFINAAASVENPGVAATKDVRDAFLGNQGLLGNLTLLKGQFTNPNDPPKLTDDKIKHMVAAAETSVGQRAKEFQLASKDGASAVAAQQINSAPVSSIPANTAALPPGMVKVRAPSGAIGTIPQANVAAAQAKGYTIVP